MKMGNPKKLTEVDTLEALSVSKAMTGNDTAQVLAQLLADLGTGEQVSKTAGNTPPVTP